MRLLRVAVAGVQVAMRMAMTGMLATLRWMLLCHICMIVMLLSCITVLKLSAIVSLRMALRLLPNGSL